MKKLIFLPAGNEVQNLQPLETFYHHLLPHHLIHDAALSSCFGYPQTLFLGYFLDWKVSC
jgi:hypothetical protein